MEQQPYFEPIETGFCEMRFLIFRLSRKFSAIKIASVFGIFPIRIKGWKFSFKSGLFFYSIFVILSAIFLLAVAVYEQITNQFTNSKICENFFLYLFNLSVMFLFSIFDYSFSEQLRSRYLH